MPLNVSLIDDEIINCMNQLHSIYADSKDHGGESKEMLLGITIEERRRKAEAQHNSRIGQGGRNDIDRRKGRQQEAGSNKPTNKQAPTSNETEQTMPAYTTRINGDDVEIIWENKKEPEEKADEFAKINRSKAFDDWKKSMSAMPGDHLLRQIIIQGIDMFAKKVGFVKMKAVIEDSKQTVIPGVSLLRGDSVAMLMILISKTQQKRFTILTIQPRVPTGNMKFAEIPAGMMDESNDFAGKAVEEIEEETGIEIETDDLLELTSSTGALHTSPGILDEKMRLFVFIAKIADEDMTFLNNTLTGNTEEGETISLKTIEYDKILTMAPDMKTMCAVHLYNALPSSTQWQPTFKKNNGTVTIKRNE